jgi:hypothetical protein
MLKPLCAPPSRRSQVEVAEMGVDPGSQAPSPPVLTTVLLTLSNDPDMQRALYITSFSSSQKPSEVRTFHRQGN